MGFIKNILALIGTIVVLGMVFAFVKFGGMIEGASKLDPRAMGYYMKMGEDVMATGNAAEAMVRKVKVNADITNEDLVETMQSVAEEENMQMVGDTVMFDGSLDENGKKTKYTRILSFCSRTIAKDFLGYSKAFGAFMPCRVMIREDENGDRWLYTMAMELMLYGGTPLPDDLMKKAEHVRDTMYKLMDDAATGDI